MGGSDGGRASEPGGDGGGTLLTDLGIYQPRHPLLAGLCSPAGSVTGMCDRECNNRSMAYRMPRRQGVVYGPVRPPDSGHDSGAILGRLLGAFVVVLAVGVLAAGALAFMNGPGDAPAGSASPSPSAQTSPVTTLPLVGTPPPTATPAVEPTPTASPSPTTEPTELVPQVHEGAGFVTFGTRTNSRLRIVNPRSTFGLDERMRWSAHLTEPADSDELRIHLAKLDPAAEGGERLIREDEVTPDVNDIRIFARRVRLSTFVDGPGVYAVRYMRGDQLMSEGYFLVEE